MRNTTCDQLRSILARLDHISDPGAFLMAANWIPKPPQPSERMGYELIDIYIAPTVENIHGRELTIYTMIVQTQHDSNNKPYYTCPTKTQQWVEGLRLPSLPVCTRVAFGDQTFPYDSYAVLHMLGNCHTIPEHVNHSGAEWVNIRSIKDMADRDTPGISFRMSKLLREKIFPFIKNKYPEVLP
jgi:hypothetical protein